MENLVRYWKAIAISVGAFFLGAVLISGSAAESDTDPFGSEEQAASAAMAEVQTAAVSAALPEGERANATDAPASTTTADAADGLVPVASVIDGDTIKVRKDGELVTVRLIGLDTPETVHPSKPVECFGREASARARELMAGERVRLETDPSQDARDRYRRLLAYVFREDGTLVNEAMIAGGYGHEYTYNLPYRCQGEFEAAERAAREAGRGLWAPGACEEASAPAPSSAATQSRETPSEPAVVGKPEAASAAASAPAGYSCSGNVYSCGDFGTHAEAQRVFEACGGVGSDVHQLDRDRDGVACESLP